MTDKILEVLEAVAIYGPATLDEVTEKLPRTRSSVYRSLTDLERSGWITRSINGRTFSISSKLERLADLQLSISDDVIEILDLLVTYKSKYNLVFSVMAHLKGEEFIVVDSSFFPVPLNIQDKDKHSRLYHHLCAMRNSGLLQGFIPETQLRDESQFADLIEELNIHGFTYCHSLDISIIPVVIASGELVMITCEKKGSAFFGVKPILDASETLMKSLSLMNVCIFRGHGEDSKARKSGKQ